MTANVQSSAAHAAARASPARREASAAAPRQRRPGDRTRASPITTPHAPTRPAPSSAPTCPARSTTPRRDVDEFDAALMRGAGGVPADARHARRAELEADDLARTTSRPRTSCRSPEAVRAWRRRLARHGGGGGARRRRRRWRPRQRPSGAPLRGGNRAIGFLRASWAELQRVQWPDRRQVTQATAVVLGFVAIAGALPGPRRHVAKEIVEFIL